MGILRIQDGASNLWQRLKKRGYLPKSSSNTAIPKICLAKLSDNFSSARPPKESDLLAIFEAICFHNSESEIAPNDAGPQDFYNTTEEVIHGRGDMLAKVAYQHSSGVGKSPIV